MQLPALHESERVALQGDADEHATPPLAHVVVDPMTHVSPLQHPEEHDLAVQTHLPLSHACPTPHGRLEPHWHTPETQSVESPGSHAMHELPLIPHEALPLMVQVVPLQQPEP